MGAFFNFFVATFAAIGSFLFGYDSGIIGSVISPNFKHFHEYFNNPNDDILGAVVSTFAGGCFFGAMVAGWLAGRVGRKRTIQAGSLVAILGCSLQTGAKNINFLLGGRVLAGIAIGILSMIIPLYQSEISPPKMRGFLTGMTQFMIGMGFLVANWVGYGCQYLNNDGQWRIPLAIQVAPAVLLLLGMFFLPFSPRWLIEKGRDEEALRVVQLLHGNAQNAEFIKLEFAEMVEQIKYEKANMSSKLSDLWATKPMLKAAINAKFPGETSDNKVAQRTGVAFIILFGSLFFSTSFGPVSWVYQSEIFPMRVRAKGAAVATMSNWAVNAMISQVSPIGLHRLGWKFYLVFICTNIANGKYYGFIVIFFFPETKGKSLEEMDAVFGDQVIEHALQTGHTHNVPELDDKDGSVQTIEKA
ncbi:High-affinity glucose transporter [Kluyveromyces lactis NRRL Y-1140] [Rhizoctonia solani]|uniref:High-affinity glucose transporter [Kluyveromyces lactis NRRL Y-1140] n=1 Tax=Rhizoctonia solani TaxID=456999 RepID=A0A0K6G0R1_9AGAM|nr:High-affinity glucose transporter [Kluyveromyces lactis NRRL Y-1140] [Rhizoctonia solani]